MADLARPLENATALPSRQRKPVNRTRVLTYVILIFWTVLTLGPCLWVVSASFMNSAEVSAGKLFPGTLLVSNYSDAWQLSNMGVYMWNSVRITFITVTGELLVCIPAAYAFARMNFYGRNILFAIVLSTMMIPAIATLIPNFLTVVWISRLGQSICGDACKWIDSWPSLTIPFMASAFSIFLLRQFFTQIPAELWDAARIDGAGHVRFIRSVVLPLSHAPIMTVALFGFIGSWNALMWPLLVVQTDEWRPVAFGLLKFVRSDAPSQLSLQMAAAVMMITPILILYFFTQKQFTEGIASTGLKG
jgi:multiple sugar transport system permease protein